MSAICPACLQRIRKLNPHHMDKQKVMLLDSIARIGMDSQDGWVKVSTGQDQQITGDAAVLALRLSWFFLVERGVKRSGMFRVTEYGMQFLKGIASVPSVIYCKDGQVVEWSDDMVVVSQVKDVILDRHYWSSYPSMQKVAA